MTSLPQQMRELLAAVLVHVDQSHLPGGIQAQLEALGLITRSRTNNALLERLKAIQDDLQYPRHPNDFFAKYSPILQALNNHHILTLHTINTLVFAIYNRQDPEPIISEYFINTENLGKDACQPVPGLPDNMVR